MSVRKDGKIIAGTTVNPDLFDWKWADHILDNASWLRADTFSWQSGAVYQAAYAHLVLDIDGTSLQSETIGGTTIQFYLADDGHKICPASEESNVVAIYNATGVAWYYILDLTNQRFKLPRTKFGVTGLRDAVGNYVEAGLPNITGNVNGVSNRSFYASPTADGAFYVDNYANNQFAGGGGVGNNSALLHLNASRSSSIYGNSDTVQPKATEMYLYFYVGNFTQTALENTAGLNAELFNGKVDVGHQVIEFQAPTAENNYTWYRKYADGWVEQGGLITNATTYTLPVTMADTNYYVNVCWDGGKSAYFYAADYQVRNLTTTTFYTTASRNGGNVQARCWQVSGMAA